jgi:hypothetical protein
MQAAAVVARNYLPHARVLAESFRRHHPGGRLTLLVVDGAAEAPGAEVVGPDFVGIDARELHRRAMLFDAQGVISSLRAPLLARLLGDGPVLLLDADTLVLAPLDDLWELAAAEQIVLSPHALDPMPGAPGGWLEEELLRSGTFNGGFLGVGPGAEPFLAWLAERARRDCVREPARGLLYTQTWLNLVPALFPHHVLRDRGVNAQFHGLHGRDVEWTEAGPRIGGDALRLFHFAGFDPSEPGRLCRHYPDTELSGRPGLARLCEEYAERLRAAGRPGEPAAAATGDAVTRAVYRRALLAAEAGEGPEPPDPAEPAFATWLREAPAGTTVSRYLLGLHGARADLRAAFPRVPGADEAGYLGWAAGKAAEPEPEFPPEFASASRSAPATAR